MDTSKLGEELLIVLEEIGWRIRRSVSPEPLLPPSVLRRYPDLPQDLTRFLEGLESCVNRDENAWFLCREDYRRTDEEGFRWNENELMSLEWAEGDPEREVQVSSFWDRHFPFMMAVHSDYDYLAVSLDDSSYGEVMHGFAPEFEEPSVFVPSFAEFLALFKQAASGDKEDYPLRLFL